ncbi:hypothetical protein GW17_00060478 [Ensete ventricosum]|nr:hypothetical protein GW17_00060478 [Ensete ventricosum]
MVDSQLAWTTMRRVPFDKTEIPSRFRAGNISLPRTIGGEWWVTQEGQPFTCERVKRRSTRLGLPIGCDLRGPTRPLPVPCAFETPDAEADEMSCGESHRSSSSEPIEVAKRKLS